MKTLRQLREERCIPSIHVARELNISLRKYLNIENGCTEPRKEQLQLLATLFKIEVGDILLPKTVKQYLSEEECTLLNQFRLLSVKNQFLFQQLILELS